MEWQTCTGFAAQPNYIATRAAKTISMFSRSEDNVGIGILDLDTGERWFSQWQQRFRCKRLQAPRQHCRIKTRERERLSLSQSSPLLGSLRQDGVRFLKEIKSHWSIFQISTCCSDQLETVIIQRQMR